MNFDLFSKNSILFPRDKKQRLMLVVLAILIAAILVILYLGLRDRSPELSSESPGAELAAAKRAELPVSVSELIEKIDFDTDFLGSSRFKNLKVYGDWPLEVDEKGRANPFLPY